MSPLSDRPLHRSVHRVLGCLRNNAKLWKETAMPHFLSRRRFGGLAAASAALAAAAPALAQQSNEIIKWRLTSSFPKSLDTLFGAAATIARLVGEMTDGKFRSEEHTSE